jgi:hypothetical protein
MMISILFLLLSIPLITPTAMIVIFTFLSMPFNQPE